MVRYSEGNVQEGLAVKVFPNIRNYPESFDGIIYTVAPKKETRFAEAKHSRSPASRMSAQGSETQHPLLGLEESMAAASNHTILLHFLLLAG